MAESRPVGELDAADAKGLIAGLSIYGIKYLLIVGGQKREDLFELLTFAESLGIKTALMARGEEFSSMQVYRLNESHACALEISFWSEMERGTGQVETAYHICRDAAIDVKVNIALTNKSMRELENTFIFLEKNRIHVVCFSFVTEMTNDPELCRKSIDSIVKWAANHLSEKKHEVFINGCGIEGVFLLVAMRKLGGEAESKKRIRTVCQSILEKEEGIGQAYIDYRGVVFPGIGWKNNELGSIKEKPFGEIWDRTDHLVLNGLRNKLPILKGKCGICGLKSICRGGLRARAEAVFKDPWEEDPACYIYESEKLKI